MSSVLASLQQGDRGRATDLACAALQRGEIHPLFLNLRAARLEEQGDLQSALNDLIAARKLAPGDAGVANALGLLLARMGRPLEAIRAYDDAIASAPHFSAPYFNKGRSCEEVGDLDTARHCYEATVRLNPEGPEARACLALLAVRRADYAEARSYAEAALQRRPLYPSALQALTTAQIETGDLDAAEHTLSSLQSVPGLSDHDNYLAAGLLGELRERQGRYHEAFQAFSAGNNAYFRANCQRFGANGTARFSIRWLIEYYRNRPSAADRSRARNHGVVHVFLVGFPRSGTTLIEQALACHPEVETMEERDAFGDSVRAFMRNPSAHAQLTTASEDELEQFRGAYWRRVAENGFTPSKRVFVDKLPFHAVKLPIISVLFPKAKILFAVRDPRDVVLGCFRARFRVNPYMIELLRLADAARFYADYMALIDLYRHALPLSILDIRHEDLVADFDKLCREVCEFLDIGWAQSMNDFAFRQHVRAVATPSGKQLAGGLSVAGIERWRNYASELQPVMPVLAPWITRFGYSNRCFDDFSKSDV